MEFTRLTRKYVRIPVTATIAGGDPASISGVDVALLPPNRQPAADTQWAASDYTDGTATVLIAGPDADPAGAIVLPYDCDLWIRVTDTPEVDAVKVTRLSVPSQTPPPGPVVNYVTATQLTTALADKADTDTLATVATSGAYADLTGLPAIPDSPGDIGAADLTAATQTFTGQVVIKRPTSTTSTARFTVTDETSAPRLTFAVLAGTATQLQVYGKAGEPAIVGLIGPNGTDYADFTFDGANAEIDVQGGDLNLRPLTAGHSVNIWSISGGAPILKVGSQGLAQALTLQHDGSNAHLSATAGYIGLQGDKFQVLASGAVNYTGPTSTSATAGSNGAAPAQVGGYLVWQVGGTPVKIPYFFL